MSYPSSVSLRPRSRPSASASRSTLVSWGQPRKAAVSGGTCQVSESTVLRPQMTRSAPSLATAMASVLDVPSVSATANTLSFRWIARSAPMARVMRSASSACGGPIVIVTTSPPCSSRSRIASVTAYTSNSFSSSGTPSRTIRFVSGSSRTWLGFGTCLTRTTIFTAGAYSGL